MANPPITTQRPSTTTSTKSTSGKDPQPTKDSKSDLRGKDLVTQDKILEPKDGKPKNGAPTTGGPKNGVDPALKYTWAGGSPAERLLDSERTYGRPDSELGLTADQQARLTVEALKDIPNYHVILEQLAHLFAYHSPDLSESDDIAEVAQKDRAKTQAARLKAIGYKKKSVIASNATGFQVTLFEPFVDAKGGRIDPTTLGLPGGFKLRPVLAFRGTDGGPDITDDANPKGIGHMQFTSHSEEVRAMLADAAGLGFGNADVTGHSLGGALAQRAAAAFGDLVNDIITFQAPGIDKEAARVDWKKHTSTHYMLAGDVVSRAGGAHTTGTAVRMQNKSGHNPMAHTRFPLQSLNGARRDDRSKYGALPGNSFVPGVAGHGGEGVDQLSPEIERQGTGAHDKTAKSTISEGFRGGLEKKVGALEPQAQLERVAEELESAVGAAVMAGADHASAVKRLGAIIDANRTFTTPGNRFIPQTADPAKLAQLEKNALMRFDRLSGGR